MQPQTITLLILAAAIVVLASERLRPDLVAMLVVIALGTSGVLTAQEAFSGFSRSAVITIVAVFVLAEGLQRTGVTDQMGKMLLRLAGARESWLAIVVMLSGAFLSLFMNNIAAASVLFPAVSGAAKRSGVSSSRLLMPLAYGTILGGMATLFTTSNIIVSSLLKDEGFLGFGVFDFIPLGMSLLVIGVTYMAGWGRRLLPGKSPAQRMAEVPQEADELPEVYRLSERLFQARIPADSALIGIPLGKSRLREKLNLNLVGVHRDTKTFFSPRPDFRFKKGDIILLEGRPNETSAETLAPALELYPDGSFDEKSLESQETVLVETVLSPRSTLIGRTLRDARFRDKYEMNVLAIWRSGTPIRTHLAELPLQFGDALLLQGARHRAHLLHSEPDLIVLNGGSHDSPVQARKAWLALLILGVTLLLAAATPIPVGEVMLAGALGMVLTGILTMDQVYRAIEWKSVFLVAGMLPLGIAMTKSGAAAAIGKGLLSLAGSTGPMLIVAILLLLTIVLAQSMNGAAVAAMITPIAVGVSGQLDLDPRSLAMGIAMAASITFMTPLGHAVNVLVMGPGGYRFRDYLVVGLPLTMLLYAALLVLLPILWPL